MYKRSLVALALLAGTPAIFADDMENFAAQTVESIAAEVVSPVATATPQAVNAARFSLPTIAGIRAAITSRAEQARAAVVAQKDAAVAGAKAFYAAQKQKCADALAHARTYVANNKTNVALVAAAVAGAGVVTYMGYRFTKAQWNKWLDTYVTYRDYCWYNEYYVDHYMTRRQHKALCGTYFNVKKALF
jgi:hypothetical protein